MPEHFRLSLETREATAPLVTLLRRHTGKPISDLRQVITMGQPFLDERPHHNQYSEFIARVTQLIDDLDAKRISYLIEIDGTLRNPQYLRNLFQRWHDIGMETAAPSDVDRVAEPQRLPGVGCRDLLCGICDPSCLSHDLLNKHGVISRLII